MLRLKQNFDVVECLVVPAGPCRGLTVQEAMRLNRDVLMANMTALGRSPQAKVIRAYVKVNKALSEFDQIGLEANLFEPDPPINEVAVPVAAIMDIVPAPNQRLHVQPALQNVNPDGQAAVLAHYTAQARK